MSLGINPIGAKLSAASLREWAIAQTHSGEVPPDPPHF